MSIKLKLFLIISIALFVAIFSIWDFLAIDETNDEINWTPFNKYFEYATINFKTMLIGSSSNFIIFILKPVGNILVLKIYHLLHMRRDKTQKGKVRNARKRRAQGYQNNQINEIVKRNDVVQSTSVYNRPFFQWNNINR